MNKKFEESFNTFYTDIVSNLQQKNNPKTEKKAPFLSNTLPYFFNQQNSTIYYCYNSEFIITLNIMKLTACIACTCR